MFQLDEAGRDAAHARRVPVAPDLEDIIELIWIDGARSSRTTFRIVADHAPHILYKIIRGPRAELQRVDVVGARSAFIDVDKSNRVFTCGVRLRPGAIPRLFRASAAEFCNRAVPIADVAGASGGELLQRLGDAAAEHSGDVLQGWLRQRRVAAATPRLADLDRALRTPLTRVAALAHRLGLSSRAVQLYLRHQVGLAPKRYLQVHRLLRALQDALPSRERNWSRAAAAAGFTDQSHFIRECRQLLGETPEQFALRAGPAGPHPPRACPPTDRQPPRT
jgi:AraC-like DNA-binding protein